MLGMKWLCLVLVASSCFAAWMLNRPRVAIRLNDVVRNILSLLAVLLAIMALIVVFR
jgi:hypothetical protein